MHTKDLWAIWDLVKIFFEHFFDVLYHIFCIKLNIWFCQYMIFSLCQCKLFFLKHYGISLKCQSFLQRRLGCTLCTKCTTTRCCGGHPSLWLVYGGYVDSIDLTAKRDNYINPLSMKRMEVSLRYSRWLDSNVTLCEKICNSKGSWQILLLYINFIVAH